MQNRDPFWGSRLAEPMIAVSLTRSQHTIRFAATRKGVAVTKREAKSAGMHRDA